MKTFSRNDWYSNITSTEVILKYGDHQIRYRLIPGIPPYKVMELFNRNLTGQELEGKLDSIFPSSVKR